MAFTNIFSTTTRGALTFTGNSSGLSQFPDQNAAGTISSIGAFTSITLPTPVVSDFPTSNTLMPTGTTLNISDNGSAAVLNIPVGSTILYAQLIWGGNYYGKDGNIGTIVNISGLIDNPVVFKTPLTTSIVAPAGGLTSYQEIVTIPAGVVFPLSRAVGFYTRSQDVTALVQASLGGTYSVEQIPGIVEPIQNVTSATNHAGWTLAVAYENPLLPYRNLNIYVGGQIIHPNGVTIADIDISGFITPSSGTLGSRLLVSAQEGDADIPGDQLLYGPTVGTLVPMFGPNNSVTNFFGSQINNDSGNLDQTGTFGTRNQDPFTLTNMVAGRQSWDITNIDSSSQMNYNQTSAKLRFTTAGDAYMPDGIGVQIDSATPIITIDKIVDKSTVILGDTIAYTLVITNTSSIPTNNFTVIDTVPTGTSIIPSTVTVANATGPIVDNTTTTLLNIDIGPVNTNQSVTISYILTTDENTTLPILNTANGDYTFTILDETLPDSSASNRVNTDGLLITAVKSGDPGIATLGDTITYTVTITNTGNTIVNNVYFSDTLPEGTSLASGSSNPNPPSSIPVGSIGAGSTSIVAFEVILTTLPINETIPNTGAVNFTYTTNPSDPEGSNGSTDTNTVITTVPRADISVDKTGAPSPVVSGETLTYTMIVTNNGPYDAQNVTLTDTVPPCLLNPQYSINGGVFSGWNGNIPLGTIVNGTTVAVNIRGTIDPSCIGTIVNTAVVTSSTPDPTPDNNISTATIPLNTSADIGVIKTGNPSPVVAGNTLTYTIIVSNDGPSDAQNVALTDTVPPCLLNPQYSVNGGVFSPWNGNIPLGTVVNGATVAVNIRGTVDPSCTGNIVNTAVVTTSTPDPTPNNNTSTATIPLNTSADISVVKSGNPTPVVAGNTLTYTMTVTNAGPSVAQSVTLADAIPPCMLLPQYSIDGVNFTPWSGDINLGDIAINASTIVYIRGLIDPVCTGTIVNTATVNSITPDPTPGNNTSTATIPLNTSADISVVKSGNPTPVVAGNTLTYTMTVTNAGPSVAQSVTLADAIPPCMLLPQYSIDGTNFAPWPGSVNLGNIAVNGSTIVYIRGKIDSSCTGNIANTATVNSVTPDPTPGNNTSSVTVPINASADISVVKSGNPTPVVAGNTLTYTMTVTNAGPSVAQSVTLADAIPPCMTLPQYSIDGTNFAPWTGSRNLGNIGVNSSTIVYIRGKIDSSCTGNIANTAVVNSSTPDPTPDNNTSTVTVPINASADISVVKTSNKDFVTTGNEVIYTMTVSNSGPSDAANVILTDAIPTSIQNPQYSTDGINYSPWLGSINIGTVAVGVPQTVFIKGTIAPNAIGTIPNTTTITSSTPDPNQGNNTSTKDISVRVVNLTKVKSTDKAFADVGETITYTISVTNNGNTDANNLVIIDSIPNGTSLVSGSVTSNVAITGNNPQTGITINNPVAPGQTITMSFKVVVTQIPNTNPIPNTATINYKYTVDPRNPNTESRTENTNTVTTQVNRGEITPNNAVKSASKNPTTPGDIITYTVSLTNTGNVPVNNVVIKDVVPLGTTFVSGSVTVGGVSKPNENPNLGINVGTIGPNSTVVTTFKVEVLQGAPSILTNTANVDYNYTVDPTKPPIQKEVTTNKVDVDVLVPNLSLTKSANRTGAIVGDIIRYSISANNNGQIDLDQVIIKDLLPPELSFNGNLTIDNVPSGQNITFGVNIGNLPIGATKIVSFDAKVISVPNDGIAQNTSTAAYDYTVTGSSFEGMATSNEVSVPIFNPKLDITKTSSKDNLKVGDIFEYTINVKNNGNIDINNTIITDDLPPEFSVLGIKVNGVSVVGNIATGLNLGTIKVNETKVVVLTIKVMNDLDEIFKNVTTVNGTVTPDPNFPSIPITSSGTDEIGVTVYDPKLDLVKSVDKEYVAVGDTVTYTIIAKNSGDLPLGILPSDSVIIYDMLAPSLDFIVGSVVVDGVTQPDAGITSGVDIGVLNVGESKTITFEAKVISNDINPIENTSTATFGYQVPGRNPQLGETTSNTVSIIPILVNLDIVKTADKDFAVLGDTITYTVKLTNNGDLDISNVIFKDKLPQGVELINGSFKVNGVVINSVNLQGGVNIGIIPKKTTTTVQYSVKVVAPNCSMVLVNEASAKFNFVFPDGTIGTLTSGPTSASVTSINLGIANFKQFSIEEYLQIPGMKPNIEAINFVDGKVDIVKCHIVETGNIKSIEGQSLTGYKLVIHGVLKVVVEYTACEDTQSVHSASYDIPFSTFIVLPKNYITGTKIELDSIVEDIYYKVVNCRIFFTNITVLINAKILSC